MDYFSAEEFIRKHLRYKQHWNKKLVLSSDAHSQTLENDTHIGGCEYAKGSVFKVFETQNFGWICFQQNTKTPDGNTPGKLIHQW